MYRNILIILGLLSFTACSQNQPEPKAQIKVKQVVKEPVKVKAQAEVLKEFIPEHIKRSRIEVVKHY